MFGLLTKTKKIEDATHICCNDCNQESTIEDWDGIMSWMGEDFPSARHLKATKAHFNGKFQCPKCFEKHTIKELNFK